MITNSILAHTHMAGNHYWGLVAVVPQQPVLFSGALWRFGDETIAESNVTRNVALEFGSSQSILGPEIVGFHQGRASKSCGSIVESGLEAVGLLRSCKSALGLNAKVHLACSFCHWRRKNLMLTSCSDTAWQHTVFCWHALGMQTHWGTPRQGSIGGSQPHPGVDPVMFLGSKYIKIHPDTGNHSVIAGCCRLTKYDQIIFWRGADCSWETHQRKWTVWLFVSSMQVVSTDCSEQSFQKLQNFGPTLCPHTFV